LKREWPIGPVTNDFPVKNLPQIFTPVFRQRHYVCASGSLAFEKALPILGKRHVFKGHDQASHIDINQTRVVPSGIAGLLAVSISTRRNKTSVNSEAPAAGDLKV
jgi:hypothetical protein